MITHGKWTVHEHYTIHNDQTALVVVHEDAHGKRTLMGRPPLFQTDYGGPTPNGYAPFFSGEFDGGTNSLLQAFLNLAWEKGLRPAGFEDTKNQLKAVGEHLNDMRAIVAKNLDVQLP